MIFIITDILMWLKSGIMCKTDQSAVLDHKLGKAFEIGLMSDIIISFIYRFFHLGVLIHDST